MRIREMKQWFAENVWSREGGLYEGRNKACTCRGWKIIGVKNNWTVKRSYKSVLKQRSTDSLKKRKVKTEFMDLVVSRWGEWNSVDYLLWWFCCSLENKDQLEF